SAHRAGVGALDPGRHAADGRRHRDAPGIGRGARGVTGVSGEEAAVVVGVAIRRLLVANRGEIAVRIIRACREMGVESVAVHSDADAGAMHVNMADRAVSFGAAAPEESYLSIPKLVGAAQSTGADAIH